MARVAVSNSSPLIVLGAIGRIDLLRAVFDSVLVPEEVAREVRELPTDSITVAKVQDKLLVRALTAHMDIGEAAAIALACEQPDASIILDDRKGRREARGLGLRVVGTIGIVVEAKRTGAIPKVLPVVEALVAEGLFASEAVIRQALSEAGE